jgi:hypothetical protein
MSSKKKESVLTKQTIENKKNLPLSARRSYWRPVLPLAHHSTAKMKTTMSFYESYGWKVNWKTVTSISKKMTYEKKKIAFISCQMNTEERNDICLRLPWLAVEALIMEKRIWTQRASEPAKSDPRPLPHLKGGGVSPLDKNYENGPWQFAKSSAMASFLTNKT